jgi:hypothetical protein
VSSHPETAKENDLTSARHHLHVETEVHQQVALLARSLGITPGQAIAHLLDLYVQSPPGAPAHTDTLTPVYAVYEHRRIEGYFDRSTGTLSIPAGPGAGQYKTPSGAANAVIAELRPQVSPTRTGWRFWRISGTGAYLVSIRDAPTHTSATASPPALPPLPTSTTSGRRKP